MLIYGNSVQRLGTMMVQGIQHLNYADVTKLFKIETLGEKRQNDFIKTYKFMKRDV